jgi:hypothetical protein
VLNSGQMLFSLLASACAIRLTLGAATLYEVSVAATARERTRASFTGVLGELQAETALMVSRLDREVDLRASYSPRFVLQQRGTGLQALHRASVRGAWRIDRRWRLLSSLDGSFGTNDFLLGALATPASPERSPPQPAQPGPAFPSPAPLQPVPQLTSVRYVSAEASMGLEGALAAGTRLVGAIAAVVAGGADATAQQFLPLERGARLVAELEWTASAADTLATAVAASYSSFVRNSTDGTSEATDVTAGVTQTWRRGLGRSAHVRAGIGPTVTAHREGGSTIWGLVPSAEVGVHDRVLDVLEGDVALRAVATIDRITTAVYQRVDLTGAVTWRPALGWTLAAVGSGGLVVSGSQSGDKSAAGELRAGWSPGASWELAFGVRALSQIPHTSSTRDVTEATAFLGASARHRDRL